MRASTECRTGRLLGHCLNTSDKYNRTMSATDPTDTKRDERQTDTNKDKPHGQSSDIHKYIDNQQLRTNPFDRSLTAEHIYKRAERIAAALFLVTGHVLDVEPLKMSVRASALELIDRALSVHMSLRAEESPQSRELLSSIRVAISRVRLLGISGYVSHPNVAVLVSALDEMGHLLSSAQRSTLSEHHVLSHDDLVPAVPRPEVRRQRAVRDVAQKDMSDKGHIERSESTTRSERIISLLRTKDLMGIKDISVNLPEYSEKMIQRELADLVDAGRVRKVGAKRWSRYGFVR